MAGNYYEQLNSILKEQNRSQEDFDKIKVAFDFAFNLHSGQYRVSEEPYIVHPVEVSCILANLKADTNTICAALLHDILEDTDTKPEEIKKLFGQDVLNLVEGVTKLSKFKFHSKEERQAESFRKMFLAMAEDIRVIFLKLADRLHNMRTLNYMIPDKQKKIARETLEIFAPLANRLGIGKIKAELEDLSLRYLYPEKYYEIAQLVAQNKGERESIVQVIIDKIEANLKQLGINAIITGRAKHYYSIYYKMMNTQKSYHDLYDIHAVRVIVDTEKECYEVLGVIHSSFKPIPGRFKDYIAMPKSNLYRSLHTSLIGPRGKPIEVQIRTKDMHEEAEFGIAAHWKYKEVGSQRADSNNDEQFSFLRKMQEFQQEITDAKEYVDSVKLDLFSDQVFVFSPMGDVYDLPYGAVPIDFAYRVHTQIGHKCTGALVNGKIVPLDTKLENGDIIEILTSKVPKPRLDWINIVATNAAKSKIRQWFKKNLREDNIHQGKNLLQETLTIAKFDEHYKSGKLKEIAEALNYMAEEDLFAAIGYGEVTCNKIINRLETTPKPLLEINKTKKMTGKSTKVIQGLEGLLYHIAKCCAPVPGESIIGVVTRSKGVTVHRSDCKNLDEVEVERYLNVAWSENDKNKTYVTHIRIEAIDRVGILKDVLARISDSKTNIVSANTKSKNKKLAIIDLSIEINDLDHLNTVMTNIKNLCDVISVMRQQSGGTSHVI